MKKIGLFAIVALAALASCTKEMRETAVTVPSGGDMVYTTIQAGGEDLTKVVLDFASDKNMKWQDTDVIAVFDGVGKNNFTVKQGTNTGASAVFEGTVDSGATTLYAVYPASAAGSLDGSSLSVTVPEAQVIGTGACADPAALVSVASAAKGASMNFKQVCGLLKLSFTAEDIRTITITGNALAGTATVASDGTLVSVSNPAGSITLTHADGLFPAGTYYVAVLPGTTPAGSFSISLSDGLKAGVKEASSEVSFSRCKGLNAGSLDGLTMYRVISTMAELFDWNATRVVKEESEPENVMLAADIDMENEPWTPKDFKGVFDGKGHKLYNLNVERSGNACLFNTLTGTIKNLTVGTKDGEKYDGVSRLVQNNQDDTKEDNKWRYAGLITRLDEGAVLDNVVNFVPVTVAETSVSMTRIGGLVAIVAGAATIIKCENCGAVSNLATAPVAEGAVGGVVGWADAPLTADTVINTGEITVANASTTYIGGILSSDAKGGATLADCFNKANISVTSTGSHAMCIGGILGDGNNSSLIWCDNFGAISSVCDGELKVGGILGRASMGCTLENCTNGNEGTITFKPETFGSQAFVGGIVGNSPKANTGTLTIKSCKNYAPINATHRNICSVGGVAGFFNIIAGTFIIENCENHGDITRIIEDTAQGTEKFANVSGLAANLVGKAGSGSKISGCVNYGKVTTNANAASTVIRVGGVAAWLQQYTDVENCENKGEIRYEMGDAKFVGSYLIIGGVIGHLVKGSSATGCSNSGKVFSDRKQVTRAGGIVGTINSSAVYSCTNTGEVEVSVSSGTVVSYWQAVGGIAGFAEGTTAGCTRAIQDCVNRGAVSASINAKPNYEGRFGVGGIIGHPFSSYSISGNKNYGAVSAENTNEEAPWSYAGGVMGFDDDSHEKQEASTITGNVNYGEITNASADANYSAAGGLFGRIKMATGVTGSSFGSVKGPGTGAVAGVNKTDIAVTLCDAVTVNDVTKAAAPEEAAWLCPANKGTITPTYVAHNSGE